MATSRHTSPTLARHSAHVQAALLANPEARMKPRPLTLRNHNPAQVESMVLVRKSELRQIKNSLAIAFQIRREQCRKNCPIIRHLEAESAEQHAARGQDRTHVGESND